MKEIEKEYLKYDYRIFSVDLFKQYSVFKLLNVYDMLKYAKDTYERAKDSVKMEKEHKKSKNIRSNFKKYPLTEEECNRWLKNKSINPRTGRKIHSSAPTYKKIAKQALELYGKY